MSKQINGRCPLQFECERKSCKFQHHERDCAYYQGNARPGAEIEDQAQAMEAEWEARMTDTSVLGDQSAPAAPQDVEPVVVQGDIGSLVLLPVDKLLPHLDNPRKDLGDLQELADSIKANGVLQNLTVVSLESEAAEWSALAKQYQEHPTEEMRSLMNRITANQPTNGEGLFRVVIGHRRLAAAKLAGLAEVPCVISNMDYREQVRTMLMENIQRSDLTVYEQAQGFQMMLDLGDSVEDIAAKSGFSKTTVRRRVKMLELDQGTLKAVSERQLSLTDFDELAKIEDAKARNACLVEIGTANFNQSVTTQLRQQAIKKRLPAIKKQLKSSKAIALKQSDTWSGKYESLNAEIIIPDWDGESRVIPEKVSGQLYYYLDESWGRLRFFQERQKPAPVKRPAAEIAKEKRIAAAWAGINEKAAITYQMRSEFVHSLTWGKKTSATILQGALIAGVLKTVDYMSSDREAMEKALGLEEKTSYSSDRGIKALAALQKLDVKQIASAIYALFDDSKKENYASGFRGAYPGYAKSTKLDGLYLWLTSLGYQMSDEEKALQDGTHELFREGEPVTQKDKEAAQDE